MAENTSTAKCSEAEYEMARAAGLLIVTTADEIAIHKFAEAVRKSDDIGLDALREARIPYLSWWDHAGQERAISLARFQRINPTIAPDKCHKELCEIYGCTGDCAPRGPAA